MAIALASFLVPRNGATWYLLEDKYLKGGLRICNDVTERAAIHPSSLKKGMLVLVLTDNKLYQLKDLATKTWAEYKIESSAPASNPFFTYTQQVPTDLWIINHGKNNRHFTLSIYDDEGNSVYPDGVKIVDANNVEIRFLFPIGGHCVFGFDASV